MILSHSKYTLPTFLDGNFKPIGTGRKPGMHLSHIVRRMLQAQGAQLETPEGEQEWMRAQIGFLWEAAIEWAWKEYQGVIRPVQRDITLELDEIHMTPDGIYAIDSPSEIMLEEYKLTWKSMRKWEEAPEEEFWHWMVQTKGYMYAWNQRHPEHIITRVRFLVFWAGGAYQFKPGRGPQPTETIIEWTPQELEDNWKTVLRYKAFMEKEADDETVL